MSKKIPHFPLELTRMEMRELLVWGRTRLHILKNSKRLQEESYSYASDLEFATKLYTRLHDLACTDTTWREVQKERESVATGRPLSSQPPSN